jgi:hypothetical protein
MIYKRPLRLTTLHFEHRFRIDDETFIDLTPNDNHVYPNSQRPDYTCQYVYRPDLIMVWSGSVVHRR